MPERWLQRMGTALLKSLSPAEPESVRLVPFNVSGVGDLMLFLM
jgi:hypothetical protein